MAILRVGPEQTRPRGIKSWNGSAWVDSPMKYYNGSDWVDVTESGFELVRTTPTALSQARYHLVGASVGNYALFGGGVDSTSRSSTVDAYSTEIVKFY